MTANATIKSAALDYATNELGRKVVVAGAFITRTAEGMVLLTAKDGLGDFSLALRLRMESGWDVTDETDVDDFRINAEFHAATRTAAQRRCQ